MPAVRHTALPSWACVRPARADEPVAHWTVAAVGAPRLDEVDAVLTHLRTAGFETVVTSALSPTVADVLLAAGFEPREHLCLLEHAMADLPDGRGLPRTRRARRSDREAVLAVDARAFGPSWCFDGAALDGALQATPVARFRVAGAGRPVVAYAVTGRTRRTGYLQRLAVEPDTWRQRLGRALVVDALSWLARHRVQRAVVNTQLDNVAALALYRSCGFIPTRDGLVVLGRAL